MNGCYNAALIAHNLENLLKSEFIGKQPCGMPLNLRNGGHNVMNMKYGMAIKAYARYVKE